MRLLQVISGIEPESGGPTGATLNHCRAMCDAGFDVGLAATWKSQTSFPLAEQARAAGIDVTLVGPTRWPFQRHPGIDAALLPLIEAADVVHVRATWEWIEHRAAVLARRLGKPYVWTPHGMLDRWNMIRHAAFKKACLALYLRRDLNAAARLHVASAFEAENVGRLGLRTPLFVQGHGLDAARFRAGVSRGQFRAARGLGDGPVVLFLGRIQHGKGLEMLVPALAAMRTPATLVVAGPDEAGYRQRIETLVAAHGVGERVRFVGLLGGEEKLDALRDADVLAAPSMHENFSHAVAEALATGTPVVVSDQVGLAALVAAHDLGEVTPLDAGRIAGALDRVLTPDAARRERCRQTAAEQFDWPAVTRRWVELYSSLLP